MKKELTPLLLLISATIVFSIVSALGMIYSLFKAVYESFQLKFWKGILNFIKYWLFVLYQFWNVLKYLFLHLAISKDLFCNVAAGEMIEDCVTVKEETLYGRGDLTISAATGKLEIDNELNKCGKYFTWLLSKTLGERHSINAYIKEKTNSIMNS